MAVNKSVLLRFLYLDECLKSRAGKTIDEIQEYINNKFIIDGIPPITSRAVYNDIQFLRNTGVFSRKLSIISVESGKGRKHAYRYEYIDESIFNFNLGPDEKLKIRSGLEILIQTEAFAKDSWFKTLAKAFEIDDSQQTKIIDIEKNSYSFHNKYFDNLYLHIKNKEVLNIYYQDFQLKKEKWVVHPYLLKQYNSRWYLMGIEEKSGNIFQFPIDRIEKITVNESISFYQTEIDWERRFNQIIGISYFDNENLETLILETDTHTWKYLKTRPLHSSQSEPKNEKGKLRFTIRVRWNKELEKSIMAYGSAIEVLAPMNIRNRFKEIYEKGLMMYEK